MGPCRARKRLAPPGGIMRCGEQLSAHAFAKTALRAVCGQPCRGGWLFSEQVRPGRPPPSRPHMIESLARAFDAFRISTKCLLAVFRQQHVCRKRWAPWEAVVFEWKMHQHLRAWRNVKDQKDKKPRRFSQAVMDLRIFYHILQLAQPSAGSRL